MKTDIQLNFKTSSIIFLLQCHDIEKASEMYFSKNTPIIPIDNNDAKKIMTLCCENNALEIITDLIKRGIEINNVKNNEENLFDIIPYLHIAIQERNKELVKILLENGADPLIFDLREKPFNAMDNAVLKFVPEIAKILIDSSKNVETVDKLITQMNDTFKKTDLNPAHMAVISYIKDDFPFEIKQFANKKILELKLNNQLQKNESAIIKNKI